MYNISNGGCPGRQRGMLVGKSNYRLSIIETVDDEFVVVRNWRPVRVISYPGELTAVISGPCTNCIAVIVLFPVLLVDVFILECSSICCVCGE